LSCNTSTGQPEYEVPAEQKGVTEQFVGMCRAYDNFYSWSDKMSDHT